MTTNPYQSPGTQAEPIEEPPIPFPSRALWTSFAAMIVTGLAYVVSGMPILLAVVTVGILFLVPFAMAFTATLVTIPLNRRKFVNRFHRGLRVACFGFTPMIAFLSLVLTLRSLGLI